MMELVASEDAASKPKGMCIATRCTSVDHFVEMFHRFVDEDSFFVSTNNTRPPGLETSFSVQLTDGTPVLRGLCVVLQAWTSSASPFKTPGVRLGIKRLTASSMPVFERLLVTRSRPPLPSSLSSPSLPVMTTTPPPLSRRPDSTPTQVLDGHFVGSKTDINEPKTIVATRPGDSTETRTPGSSYVLPANPLMNLSDESLEGYVDCTLYEETANYFPAGDDGSPEDALVPPPKAAAVATSEPLFTPRPVSRNSAPVELVTEEVPQVATVPVPSPRLVRASVPTPPPAPVIAIPPKAEPLDNFDSEPSVIIERSPDLRFDDSVSDTVDNAPGLVLESSAVTRPPVPTVRRPVLPTPPEPAVVSRESAPAIGFASRDSSPAGEIAMPVVSPKTERPRRKRYVVIAAGAAALSLAAIVSINTLGADGETAVASAQAPAPAATVDLESKLAADVEAKTPEPAVAEPTPTPVPDPAPPAETAPAPAPADDVEAAVAAEENPDPDGDGGVLAAGEGPCRIDVASTPAGSMVYLDGAVVAPSPIAIQTSCGKHKIDIKHPRYKLLTKAVSPTETEPAKVEVTLQRPTHVVSFLTNPPGATVFIDGRRAGTTPTTVNMLGFSNLKIEIKKTGYAPVSTRHYSKVAQDKFIVKLRKW